tara:strand:+ start:49 stop:222 length:174 start_codon:yes stop_codon:yes gene_type:complete
MHEFYRMPDPTGNSRHPSMGDLDGMPGPASAAATMLCARIADLELKPIVNSINQIHF